MSASDSYDLARLRLPPNQLYQAIERLYAKPEMLHALKRGGFYLKGIRLESLSREELADWIADAFWKEPDFGKRIAARLDEATAELKSEIAATTPERFIKGLGPLEGAIFDRSLPAALWALATDPREAAERATRRLIERARRTAENSLAHAGDLEELLGEIEQKEQELQRVDTEIERVASEVTRRAERAEKRVFRDEKKLQLLRERREDQGRQIAALEEERARLRREKEGLARENQELGREIADLRNSRPALRQAEQRIRELEKETARLEHDLERERRAREALDLERVRADEAERRARELGRALEEAEARSEEARFTYEAVTSDLRAEAARLRARMVKERERGRPVAAKERPYREQRVGIFLDVSNLYRAGLDFYRRQIDYHRFTQAILNGRTKAAALAFVVESAWGDKSAFFEMLRGLGYEVRSKDLVVRADGSRKGDWDVGIAADIIERLPSLDVIALGSGDGDFLPVVKKAQERGVAVEVYAFPNTAAALKEEADYFPIDESLLQEEISRFARPNGVKSRDELVQEISAALGVRLSFLRKLAPGELSELLRSLSRTPALPRGGS